VIANIERVANLFVTKTVYALLLALAVGIMRWPYPFLPRHLTIVSSLTIGIPAFFLALGPSRRRYVPGFVARVLRFASRAGLVAAAATFTAYAFARGSYDVTLDQDRTAATITLMCVGLWILGLLARPFTRARVVLVAAMAGAFALTLVIPQAREFFALDIPPLGLDLVIATIVVIAIGILELGWHATHGGGTRDAQVVAGEHH
jgi:cation-transporting ATPase E